MYQIMEDYNLETDIEMTRDGVDNSERFNHVCKRK